jgi:hypothetical protein
MGEAGEQAAGLEELHIRLSGVASEASILAERLWEDAAGAARRARTNPKWSGGKLDWREHATSTGLSASWVEDSKCDFSSWLFPRHPTRLSIPVLCA